MSQHKEIRRKESKLNTRKWKKIIKIREINEKETYNEKSQQRSKKQYNIQM